MLCDNLEWVGWGRRWERGSRGEQTHVYLWLIHAVVWQRPTQYCKAIILQLNKERNTQAGKNKTVIVLTVKCLIVPSLGVELKGRSGSCYPDHPPFQE